MKLTQEQIQVVLTGTFGDGAVKVGVRKASYRTNCKMPKYLEFKASLLGELFSKIWRTENNGFSKTYIYSLSSYAHEDFRKIHCLSLEDKLELLTDLGVALWFYDDGSLHKKNMFYNLNTHSFSKEDNEIISKFLNKKYNLRSRVIHEKKKDGRIFWYIYIPATGGAITISNILKKYYVEEYKYKILPEEYAKQLTQDIDDILKNSPDSNADEIAKGLSKTRRSRARKKRLK